MSRRAELTAAALAAALFVCSWGLLHVGFWKHGQIVDTPVYENYGLAMTRGAVPYRDFAVEYPPLALPVFVVPALLSSDSDGYRSVFELVMAACGVAVLVFVALSARLLHIDARPRLAFVALFPLALGTVVLTRFDLWPALLTSAALAALLSGRNRLGAGVLGAATAAKIYPAVLLPLAIAWVWRRRGRRDALIALAVFAGVLAAAYAPFLVLSPHGVASSLGRQLSRPLQIESLGAGILLVAHQLLGLGIRMESGSGSQNLAGGLPGGIAVVQSVVQIAALAYVWARFARGPAEPERLARYAAASVVAFVALGKVLSPQFMIWLVPLVVLARGRALVLLAGSLVVTQLWFPFRYWQLAKEFAAFPSWLVLGRDLLLVALLVVLVRRPRERARTG